MNAYRSLSILALLFASMVAFAQPQALDYRFSFGNRLVVTDEPQRVVLTIENVFGAPVGCGLATLFDIPRGNAIFSRVRFRIVPGQDGCIGGSCTAIIGPPPTAAIWASVGPFAVGETKTCAFDVSLAEPIFGPILLTGSAGPIEVLASETRMVPTLSSGVLAFLLLTISATAIFAFAPTRR